MIVYRLKYTFSIPKRQRARRFVTKNNSKAIVYPTGFVANDGRIVASRLQKQEIFAHILVYRDIALYYSRYYKNF